MVGCAFFSHLFGVPLLAHAFIALGLTVWIIYTTDHLIDAHKISAQGDQASTERHRYHQKYFNMLLLLVIGASFIVGMEVFFLSKPVLYAGVALAILVVGYILALRYLKLAKELLGALLYTAGVIVAPLSILSRDLEIKEWAIVILFALTALANLLLFSWYGQESDKKDDHPSFTTTFGEPATRVVLITLFVIIAIMVACLLTVTTYVWPVLILLGMNSMLIAVFVFRNFFGPDDRYRRFGDSIFLLPLIYIILLV